MKNEESDNAIITIDTKPDFEKNECYDIGTRKRLWIRNCPNCDKILFYSSLEHKRLSQIKNANCNSCAANIRRNGEFIHHPKNLVRKCHHCHNILTYSNVNSWKKANENESPCKSCGDKNRRKYDHDSNNLLRRKCPNSNCGIEIIYSNRYARAKAEACNKLCLSCSKKGNGHKTSEITKRKQRLSALKRIKNFKGQVLPNYNFSACKFIEEYGKKNGYDFQHAMNGGEYHIKELGYFVDGYDIDKNIVFEYDENRHFNSRGEIKEKDINRMNEIKRHIKCKFIRYNEKLNEIREY